MCRLPGATGPGKRGHGAPRPKGDVSRGRKRQKGWQEWMDGHGTYTGWLHVGKGLAVVLAAGYLDRGNQFREV